MKIALNEYLLWVRVLIFVVKDVKPTPPNSYPANRKIYVNLLHATSHFANSILILLGPFFRYMIGVASST